MAHLDAQNLDADAVLRRVALSGEEGAQGLRLETWLAERESGHRFVLYQADAQPSPWTRRCLRHADHVLLVAHASSGTARREIERTSLETENLRTAPSCTLVLISRDASESPPDMARWLDPRSPTRHHRVRWDRDDDILRLARFLAGRAIGLVLGGGGARTAAHVGVLRALEEARIPIDAIGGTSGGAVVAALYAMDRDHARILREMRATFVENRPWRSVTLPLVSLVSARRLDAAAQRIYGDTRIEDLWRDFFCVSCDLISGSPVIHRRGEIWRTVRASTSLPGIMPPVPFEGRLLVDGGVMDNLPGTVMREVCGGDVIASDVSAPLRLKVDYPEAPSVPALLASWVLPGRAPIDVPNVLHVMGRVCAIAGIQRREASVKGASLYLRPPVESYRLLEFDAMERIAELAYDYASKAIADSPELGRLASSG